MGAGVHVSLSVAGRVGLDDGDAEDADGVGAGDAVGVGGGDGEAVALDADGDADGVAAVALRDTVGPFVAVSVPLRDAAVREADADAVPLAEAVTLADAVADGCGDGDDERVPVSR